MASRKPKAWAKARAKASAKSPAKNGVEGTTKRKGNLSDNQFYKIVYADKTVFIDFLRKVLPERLLAILDLTADSVHALSETSHNMFGKEQINDMVYQVVLKNSNAKAIILLEFQTKSEKNFSWRMVNYTYSVCERLASLPEYQEKPPYVFSVVYYTGDSRWTAPLDVLDTFPPLIDGIEPSDLVTGRYFLLDVKHDKYPGGTDSLCALIIRAERAVFQPEDEENFFQYIQTFLDILRFVEAENTDRHFSPQIREMVKSWVFVWLKTSAKLSESEIKELLMDDGISIRDRILKRLQAQRKQEDEQLAKRILLSAEEEKQRAVAKVEEEKQRALAEAGAEAEADKLRALAEAAERSQHAVAEVEKAKDKERDLALLRMLKDSIFSLYQCRFFHNVPEEVQKTVDKAQPKDMPALHAISDYLSGHKGDEEEFMRFAKTSLA
ncbi:MAG: Rpn family recombination-promoting nuclease/putative transposase [Proteobacteria bacterium]|uniref:Rpn family recombination-promoting nuclease/putative transposase n=1 Tax=Candidatus Avisuccinivibrio stercorigallinarum TaxID=2840704 RepID=A0A9D9DDL9_9GAMM|nr:Rpn family recombination-promoting nuclease/putative transposase [Candidatus Avisuccinivibrio stercorigallinarum]